MKVNDLEQYNNDQLWEIVQLTSTGTSSAAFDAPIESNKYPQIVEYVNKENKQSGNYATRKRRVITLVEKIVFTKFLKKELK